jgi:AraC family transcriptional regulator
METPSALVVASASYGDTLNSSVVERSVFFSTGCIEIRKYSWDHPVDETWMLRDFHFLDISLSPRPGPTRAIHLDLGSAPVAETLGRIMFVPAGHTVRTSCANGRQRSMHCMLASPMIEEILGRRPSWDEKSLREGFHLRSPEVEWLLRRMYREVREAPFATEVLVESLASALSVELIRRFKLSSGEPGGCSGGLPPWRMRLIRERAYASEPAPRLTELAGLCGLTVRHLSRAFKAETGQSLGKFVEAATLDRARALLADTRLPICEIATMLGFSNSTSFGYAFRRATGLRLSEVGRRIDAA